MIIDGWTHFFPEWKQAPVVRIVVGMMLCKPAVVYLKASHFPVETEKLVIF